jgi:hypothetical protein
MKYSLSQRFTEQKKRAQAIPVLKKDYLKGGQFLSLEYPKYISDVLQNN